MPQRPGRANARSRRARGRNRPTARAASPRRLRRKNSAHIIGVVVSEIASEMMMASDSVSGEFAKQPAENAAHQQDRNEHRDQRQADRQHGEADLARAEQAPPASRGMPASRWREMFSSTTIASSTTKPVAMVSAISDRMSRL